jgi:ATPase family associated with various cellular activities (AAA)/Winged helix domain, variant
VDVRRNWSNDNQRFLGAALALMRAKLTQSNTDGLEDPSTIAAEMTYPPALYTLAECFSLSTFERDVVLLCAGVELDADFAEHCPSVPTFGMAMSAFDEPHWSAVTPAAPLRRWRLVEVEPGPSLIAAPLRIDERILHHLTGISYVDARLHAFVELVSAPRHVAPSHRNAVERLKDALRERSRWRLVQLQGNDIHGKTDVSALACAELNLQLHRMRGSDIPSTPRERDTLALLWDRESVLHRAALLVDLERDDARGALALVERLNRPVIALAREPLAIHIGRLLRLEVNRPPAGEQHTAWLRVLGPLAERVDGSLSSVVGQFDFDIDTIGAVGAEIETLPSTPDPSEALWDLCRRESRPRLDDLAQRIEGPARWDDLVLPDEQLATLRDIVAHVRHRFVVYESWGLSTRGPLGLGISAVFSGASGTGKTMAAEVLANELRLDLYRIDLSSVVSKYIGETEKNLRRLFDAAEEGGAILLFDEADALFGKRSEVKDSHDRYANIEVSYLLQRMDAYRGLAILTTNMRAALDTAFLRRIRFVVHFPFPTVEQRLQIWRSIYPSPTPRHRLHLDSLARLSVSGGSIRAIALDAAFMAADAGQPVGMPHLLQAARREYAKLEKPLADSEISGWVA